MNQTYTVTVDKDGNLYWRQNDQLHRTDGPAVELVDGTREWWLNGKRLTEEEHRARAQPKPTCEGRVIEVDGVKYQLTAL